MKTNFLPGSAMIAIVFSLPFLIPSSDTLPTTPPNKKLPTAAEIRATTAEMRFVEIPWIFDVFEGFRLAEKESRPVFLYMVSGDPLDDC